MQTNANQKPNSFLAFLMCVLACLGGALLFGIIYYIGYYVYYVTALEIVFGVMAFLKFKKSTSKGNIAVAMILSTIFVILFNLVAVVFCDALFLANLESVPFSVALQAWIEALTTVPETKSYAIQRIIEIGGMALLGCVIAIFIVVGNIKKQKQHQQILDAQAQQNNMYSQSNNYYSSQETQNPFEAPRQTQNPFEAPQQSTATNSFATSTAPSATQAQDLFFNFYTECKVMVQNYTQNKDITTFKQNVNNLKHRTNELSDDIKAQVAQIIKSEQTKLNLDEVERKTLEILHRIF